MLGRVQITPFESLKGHDIGKVNYHSHSADKRKFRHPHHPGDYDGRPPWHYRAHELWYCLRSPRTSNRLCDFGATCCLPPEPASSAPQPEQILRTARAKPVQTIRPSRCLKVAIAAKIIAAKILTCVGDDRPK